MIQAILSVLGILLWFLKRKKAKSHEDWKEDISKFSKAIADGDSDSLTLAFDRLRRESHSSDTKREGVGMPRGQK